MFAALREAAGEAEVAVDAAALPQVLDALRDRYGEPFTSRLRLCAVLVDGDTVHREADVPVPDGAELALLPPVSGGAAEPPPGDRPLGSRLSPVGTGLLARLLLAAIAGAALMLGPAAFASVVVLVAAAALLDTAGLLGRAGARPVTVAALGPGLALPATIAVRPADGWLRMPLFVAVSTLAAFALVLVFGRRAGATAGVGATAAAGLLVGVGATCLLLLRHLPDGFRWVLGFGLVVVAADVAGAALRRGRGAPGVLGEFAVPLVAAGAAAAALAEVADPPFTPLIATRTALVAMFAAVCGVRLADALATEAGIALDRDRPRLGDGRLLATVDAVLLGAPAVYLLARATLS